MIRDYTDQIAEFWPTIMLAWQEHSDKHPVIECDLANRIVTAYPAEQYIDGLSERTRKSTRQEFERVVDESGMMVFIRDSENRILQSYSYPAVDMTKEGRPHK
jgi:hypothetical protein